MRTDGVFNILGKLLILIALFMLTPIPFSIYYHDGMVGSFIQCAIISAILGGILVAIFVPNTDLGYRDGFAVVVLSWLCLALIGALPYYFSGHMPSFVDCYFEAMSGFTTTGSTILSQVEVLPKSVLFWRALTHWIGGMGIIVLSLAVLPLLGVGGMQLFQAEMPGPTKDRLTPRIQDTARILWVVYFCFTLTQTILLMMVGMDFFDAVCHAFATMATGGFSTHTASVAYFDSVLAEIIIIAFMFIAGINFTLHHHLFQGRSSAYWQSEEFRYYFGIIFLVTAVIVVVNTFAHTYGSVLETLRTASFQVVSIMTTTGFGTADFDQWPSVCKVLMVSLMFIGGCAGSTGGGIKVVRLVLFFKYARLQIRNLIHPHAVGTIKIGKVKVPQTVMVSILGFFALYIAVFILASLVVTATGVELVTGMTAVIATLNNIGPGLAQVGPAQNFGDLPSLAKWVLVLCMLAGRLELYTVVVLLTPDYWEMARKPVFRWQLKNSRI